MPSPIDTLHIHRFFWGMVKSRVSSFRFGDMPEDVHFSIGYDERSSDLNFHVTRNVKKKDKKDVKIESDKPKIVIARIDKQEWENLSMDLTLNLLHTLLRPLPIRLYGRKQRDYFYGVGFYPLPSSEPFDQRWTALQNDLINCCRSISRRKGSRLELTEILFSQLETWALLSPILEHLHRSFQWLPRRPRQDPQAGFIVSKKFIGVAIYVKGLWYYMRQDVSFEELLSACVEPRLANELIAETINAMAIIQTLNTYEEAKPYNRPFRLCKNLPAS